MLRWLGASSAGIAVAACSPQTQVVTEVQEVEVPVEKTVVVQETVVVEVGPSPDYEQGTLSVLLCCSTDEEIEMRDEINANFEAEYPGVTINQSRLPAGQNYFEKLQTLFAAGTPPDVFDMWEGYVKPYAAEGLLLSLDPFLEQDPKIKKDDILPVAQEAASWQGAIYSLIMEVLPGPVSLYYNIDHFDEAGLDYPSPDWTWDDLRDAARALTMDSDSDGLPERWGLVFDTWFVPWLYWIWSNGGDVFSADETKCTLNETSAVEAVQYWADMINVDNAAVPASELQAMQGGVNAFMTSQVSTYLGNAWDVGQLYPARDQGLNWAAVLSPRANNGNRVWYMHTLCLSAFAKTSMPVTAWKYMRDMTLELEPLKQAIAPGIVPIKQMLYVFATPENAALGYEPLLTLITQPGILRMPGAGAKWDKISGIIQAELDLVFIGEKTAAEAADTACPKVEEELIS